MQHAADTAWDRAGGAGSTGEHAGLDLNVYRWSFAYLPDPRMKSVAAGWMARVLLGADPAEMSEEEVLALSVSQSLTTRDARECGIWWDA